MNGKGQRGLKKIKSIVPGHNKYNSINPPTVRPEIDTDRPVIKPGKGKKGK